MILRLRMAMLTSVAAISAGSASADEFDALMVGDAPMSQEDLSEARGGFIAPGGWIINFGAAWVEMIKKPIFQPVATPAPASNNASGNNAATSNGSQNQPQNSSPSASPEQVVENIPPLTEIASAASSEATAAAEVAAATMTETAIAAGVPPGETSAVDATSLPEVGGGYPSSDISIQLNDNPGQIVTQPSLSPEQVNAEVDRIISNIQGGEIILDASTPEVVRDALFAKLEALGETGVKNSLLEEQPSGGESSPATTEALSTPAGSVQTVIENAEDNMYLSAEHHRNVFLPNYNQQTGLATVSSVIARTTVTHTFLGALN